MSISSLYPTQNNGGNIFPLGIYVTGGPVSVPAASIHPSAIANAGTGVGFVDKLTNQAVAGTKTWASKQIFSASIQIPVNPANGYVLTSDASGNAYWLVNSASGNYVDLTTNQTVAGIKTFSSPPVMSGASITSATIPIASVVGTAVDCTTAQTIAGVKNFNSACYFNSNLTMNSTLYYEAGLPTSSSSYTPSAINQLTPKFYVDDQIATTVLLTGNQTVAGIKTFSSPPVMSGASITSATIDKASITGVAMILTDNQTAAGIKTFSSPPIMSGASITSATIPIASVVGTAVDCTTAQTIAGIKTFSSPPVMSGASITSATIDKASVNGVAMILTSAQTAAGVKTFTSQPITRFTADGVTSTMYGFYGGATLTGANNTAFGYQAGNALTSASDNVHIGYQAGLVSTATGNTLIGSQAGYTATTQTSVTAVGNLAGCYVVGAIPSTNSTYMGNLSGGTTAASATTGNGVYIGYSARGNSTGQVAIGMNANCGSNTNSTSIGFAAVNNGANQVMLGTTTEYVQFPGTDATNGSAKFSSFSQHNMATTSITLASGTGTAVYAEYQRGSVWKKVVVYLNALDGVTNTVTFPVAFTNTPMIITTNGPAAAVVTTLTTTQFVITTTGVATTGYLFFEGY
jgi:hypothetical protein